MKKGKLTVFEKVFSRQIQAIQTSTKEIVLKAVESSGWGPSYNGSKWIGGLDPSAPSSIDHYKLRQNARKVCIESPEARTLINRSTDLVIGAGATLNLEPKYELLGITPEAAEEWARKAETLFDLWANSKAQHKSGQFCFYETMRLLFKGHKRDNEFFVRLYYSPDPSLILPLQFEILDPNQIRGDAYTHTSSLNGISDDGILRDSNGREMAYKVWITVPGTIRFEAVELPRTGPKSGRLYMIHGFTPEYAGQCRGYSELGLDIQDFKNIIDFKAANVRKAINQSNIAFTAESDSNNPSVDPFENIAGGGAGPTIETTIDPGTGKTSFSEVSEDPYYKKIQDRSLSEPGSIGVFGQPGKQHLKPFLNTAPATGHGDFIKAELEAVFSSHGMPLEVAYMSFKNNYSASQASLLLNNLNNDVELFLMAVQALDPILEMFFSCAIASGRVTCPGWQDPILHAAWMAHRWSRPPMPNIDRVKSATADKMYAELGANDLEDVAMRLNGSSFRSNVSKLKRQYSELPTPTWGFAGQAAASETQKELNPEEDPAPAEKKTGEEE